MKTIGKLLIISSLALTVSCGNGNQWHLEGQIDGLDEKDIVVLEGNNQGYWYPMDTIEVKGNGSFSYSREAQGYPDIYRLRIGEKSLYFPIDSIETISLSAQAPDIDVNHSLSGTPQAENLERVDSLLRAEVSSAGAQAVTANASLKRELGKMILADPAGIVPYYIISKRVGGQPLFNPAVKEDLRIIGAVANAFNEQRPSDPRTTYLRNLFISNRPKSGKINEENVAYANEVRAFDINLFDNEGKKHSLLDLTSKGNVVILNFTAYTAKESPAFNMMLNKVYEKYHNQGLEIFQVAFDDDEYAWKQTAKNLPWVTVLNGAADGDKALRDYNVGSLPAIFIFDRNGDVVERVTDLNTLDSSVARRL